MKQLKISSLSRHHFALKPVLWAASLATLGGLSLQVQAATSNTPDNLGSEKNGAFVSYSTPLKGGTTGEALVNGQSNSKVAFAKQGGTHIIVVDLGKDSKLSAVQMKFTHPSKVNVYVLKNKPDGNAWGQSISGMSPDAVLTSSSRPASLNGVEGEYLVIVCPNDPGALSDFSVTGFHVINPDHQWGYYQNHGEGQGGPPGEVPLPGSAYGHQPPSVPPESH